MGLCGGATSVGGGFGDAVEFGTYAHSLSEHLYPTSQSRDVGHPANRFFLEVHRLRARSVLIPLPLADGNRPRLPGRLKMGSRWHLRPVLPRIS